MSESRKKLSIPEFTSEEEEARFWDEHSPLDFEEDLEEVELTFKRPLRHTFAVPLDANTIDGIWHLASERGLKMGDMMRAWVEERYALELKKDKPARKRAQ